MVDTTHTNLQQSVGKKRAGQIVTADSSMSSGSPDGRSLAIGSKPEEQRDTGIAAMPLGNEGLCANESQGDPQLFLSSVNTLLKSHLDPLAYVIRPENLLKLVCEAPWDCSELWLRGLKCRLSPNWFGMLPTADAVGLFLYCYVPHEKRSFASVAECKHALLPLVVTFRKELTAILLLAGELPGADQSAEEFLTNPWPGVESGKALVDIVYERVRSAREESNPDSMAKIEPELPQEGGICQLLREGHLGAEMSFYLPETYFNNVAKYLATQQPKLTCAQESFLRATFVRSYVNRINSPAHSAEDSSTLAEPPICRHVNLAFNLKVFREASDAAKKAFYSGDTARRLGSIECLVTRRLATEMVWWALGHDSGASVVNDFSDELRDIIKPIALDLLERPYDGPLVGMYGQRSRIRAETYLLALSLHPDFQVPKQVASELYRTWLGEKVASSRDSARSVWHMLASNTRMPKPTQDDVNAALLNGLCYARQFHWKLSELTLAQDDIESHGLAIDLEALDAETQKDIPETPSGTAAESFRRIIIDSVLGASKCTPSDYMKLSKYLSKTPLTCEETAALVIRYLVMDNRGNDHSSIFSFIKDHSTTEFPRQFIDSLLQLYLPTLWAGDTFANSDSANKIKAFCRVFNVTCPMKVAVEARSHALKYLTIWGPNCSPMQHEEDYNPQPSLNLYHTLLKRMEVINGWFNDSSSLPSVTADEISQLITVLNRVEWGTPAGRELYIKLLQEIASGEKAF
jgi:hypothetical protein